ncbi:MAG: tRNA pseudouridine(38-40) synthase TruA [Ilumatobacter sp.]|jgi:tRNA pseudouridine38-40 synthase|uniref:tRNA pseudouridine(38-40) synthase TruA n=1 Tax=Ilumatobacter sp. TaxID=1967498 RepID=UPI00391C01B9
MTDGTEPSAEALESGSPGSEGLCASSSTRNAKLVVAYDGTDFHGFAEANDQRTVMGDLRATIEQIVRVPVELSAAGRTDAGVHGWGQVVSGRLPTSVDLARLQHSINRMCRPEIAVRSLDWTDDDFDARFSATSRAYRYDVWTAPVPHPVLARSSWHVPAALDVEAMNRAGELLLGEHDFASFCRRAKVGPGRPEKSTVRIVQRAEWRRVPLDGLDGDGALLRFEIAATSFCHQMVRSIVGTLVEVGEGRRSASSIPATLQARDRHAAGVVAPPNGLTFWHVDYDGVRWDAAWRTR